VSRQPAVGTALPRREDRALVTGEARYVDDHAPPGTVHAAFVRSQYGHADIAAIDTSAATAMDGVLAVYTLEDVLASGAPGKIRVSASAPNAVETDLPILADGRVRYAGEPIAVAVAEDRYTARDAAVG
jgi:carbon-monoxide dehydrogenase large subunit